jgi:Predicted AAA-ATPase/PD-(D/E)XK nuclease superfamily
MKNLPIGIQTLAEIQRKNCVYVDKTKLIHRLIYSGKYYFLSRPRRFGKSLLVSTLKELFEGNKAIFEGLWIQSQWDWSKTNPVIHISFDSIDYQGLGLNKAIIKALNDCAKAHEVSITAETLKSSFTELIELLNKKYGKVVILIDEYDKPILDYLETEKTEQAKANRDVLRDFYSVLKNADALLELLFITGISKFSKISIFSHLNNLTDITIDENFAALTGYTHEELELYFDEHLTAVQNKLNLDRHALLEHMRTWYNGFSWDGVTKVYNPFGTLNFLSKKQFLNFWFSTGSPRFLVEQMRHLEIYDVENSIVNNVVLDKYDIDNLALIPLLFQTGYLTIKEMDSMTGDMTLDYPNKEVRESMYQYLIDDLSRNQNRMHTGRTIQDLSKAFVTQDLEQVQKIINSILADLPHHTFDKKSEGLYHGLIHLIFSYLGVFISSEVHSSRGRADSVVETQSNIYVFEFKFNKTAQEGIDQIHKNKYAAKYQSSGKKITGIGVNFNAEKRGIDEWIEVDL